MKNNLYVIIVVYNGMRWLERCLNSVKSATVRAQIVIIDNGSTDGSADYIRANFSDVSLICSGKNLGFGKANNLGIEMALNNGAEYVYLLNQDAWVQPKTFETLIDLHRGDPDYGILSPMQVDASEIRLDKNFENLSAKKSDCFLNDLLFGKLKPVYEIHFVMAAHWLVSRDCLLAVGGFSPVFPHYGEDDDFASRARFHHFKIGFCPFCLGVHDRENRPVPLSKEAYMAYIKFLARSTDVGCPANIFCNLLRQLKMQAELSLKMHSIDVIKYLWLSVEKIPLIFRIRKEARIRRPNFLNLNADGVASGGEE